MFNIYNRLIPTTMMDKVVKHRGRIGLKKN